MQLFLYLLFVCFCLFACGGASDDCKAPIGHFTNKEGQDLVFVSEKKALWLVKFGSHFDTASFEYTINCKKDPPAIDLEKFSKGPHSGKKLLGIIDWNSDSSFRLQYEAGASEDIRPSAFDPGQTQQFFSAQE